MVVEALAGLPVLSEAAKDFMVRFCCVHADALAVIRLYADAMHTGGIEIVREVHASVMALNPHLQTACLSTLARMEALNKLERAKRFAEPIATPASAAASPPAT